MRCVSLIVSGAIAAAAPLLPASGQPADSGRSAPVPYVGVSLEQIDEPLATALNIPAYAGEIVRTVAPGSPAAVAGLIRGDVIIALNGENVSRDNGVSAIIRRQPIGASFEVVFLRKGNRTTLRVTPVARPSEAQLAELLGDKSARNDLGWKKVVADPGTLNHLYAHLSFPDETLSYALPTPALRQAATVFLISCAIPDFKFERAQAQYLNRPVGNAYVSKLILNSPKAKNWFRLRAAKDEDVGQPFLIWLAKGTVELSLGQLQEYQPRCTTREPLSDAEIRKRFGQYADAAGSSVIRTDGKISDYKWLVRGKSLYASTRPSGSKEAYSNAWVYSYDEGLNQLWMQSAYDSPGERWAEATGKGLAEGAKIIAFKADLQRSASSGGGFGGFLKGAIAGAAGMAMGASPETATESAIAGAVAGGLLGAKGEDAGMIGSAAAQGSAQGTAEVEASNSELRRISEQGLLSPTNSAGAGSRSTENVNAAASAPYSGKKTAYTYCSLYGQTENGKNWQFYISEVGAIQSGTGEAWPDSPSDPIAKTWGDYLSSQGVNLAIYRQGFPPRLPTCYGHDDPDKAQHFRDNDLSQVQSGNGGYTVHELTWRPSGEQ